MVYSRIYDNIKNAKNLVGYNIKWNIIYFLASRYLFLVLKSEGGVEFNYSLVQVSSGIQFIFLPVPAIKVCFPVVVMAIALRRNWSVME